jgi:hypothetical protein
MSHLLTKHFSTKPQLGVCCRHQLDLAAQRGGQFTISIVGNCQPSKKDKVSPQSLKRFPITHYHLSLYHFTAYEYYTPCEGNFDEDGDVDGSDLAVFAADFGRTDCP